MEILYQVPFHTQKWNLNQWKSLGFQSKDEATYWQESCCGILCLRMATEYFKQISHPTHELIAEGCRRQAYTHAYGWSHVGLVALAGDLGLHAERKTYSVQNLVANLEQGKLVMVSIKWGFIPTKSLKEKLIFWKKYGGHLALVIGTKTEGNKVLGFYVHHTSKRAEYNWKQEFIPLKKFKKSYTGRGIELSPV